MPFTLSLCSSFPLCSFPFPFGPPFPSSFALNYHDPFPFLHPQPPRAPIFFSLLCTSQDHYCTSLDDVAHSSMLVRAITPTSVPPRPTCFISSFPFLFSSCFVSSSPYVRTFGKHINCCRFYIYKRVYLHKDLSLLNSLE